MRASLPFVGAVLFAFGATASAHSAPRPGDTATRTIAAVFASCAVEREPDVARKTILEDWDARRVIKDRRLLHGGCVPPRMQLSFRAPTLKALMAGLLISRDLGPNDVLAVAKAPALTYARPSPLKTVDAKGRPLSAGKVERQKDAIRQELGSVAIAQFGECVARANPADIPPLARTVFGSGAEMAALKAFWPHMPACLPAGMKMELDRATLRDAITLAYYRLAMAARQPPTAEARQ